MPGAVAFGPQPHHCAKMKWPRTIPEDLRRRLDATLGMRSVNAATLWGDVFEWLEKHGVEAPDHALPESPEMSAQKDQ